jgi:hypothetical protein
MKDLFLIAALIFWSTIVSAQWNLVGRKMKSIKTQFSTNYSAWEYADGTLPDESYYISYVSPDDTEEILLKAVYFIDSETNCYQASLLYENKYLEGMIRKMNAESIKAGKLKWVNKDGDQTYIIVSGEDGSFWLNIYSIDLTK